MAVQIDARTERTGTLAGQLKTPPAGAGHSDRGLTTSNCRGVVMAANQSTHSPSEAHRRNQLALSILSHRDPTPDTVAAAIAALRGESLPSLVLRGA